jgi:hypothetical protein
MSDDKHNTNAYAHLDQGSTIQEKLALAEHRRQGAIDSLREHIEIAGQLRADNARLSAQGSKLCRHELERQWVGLTEERIKDIWLKGKDHGDDWADVLGLARAFESELREKNT